MNGASDVQEKIAKPTLVLVGENDESFYPEKFTSVFDNENNNIDVHIVKGANHMDIIDIKDSRNYVFEWYNKSIQPTANASAD
jgi:pimeloyl-ACP methyl ester carboxylesterase